MQRYMMLLLSDEYFAAEQYVKALQVIIFSNRRLYISNISSSLIPVCITFNLGISSGRFHTSYYDAFPTCPFMCISSGRCKGIYGA